MNVTWTRLALTANAGDTSITLEDPVDWSLGDEIVIATTGKKQSEVETEVNDCIFLIVLIFVHI